MKFELLPNEILLDLFDYFDSIDLLRAFFNLNSRLNILLYNRFQNYRFNFNSVSKGNFDLICQQHLPLISDRILALSLSDSNQTPDEINQFFSYVSSLNQFLHLRSFSFTDFRSQATLMKIFDQCQHLPNLKHLTLKSDFFEDNQPDFQLIINSVWSLPTLIYWKFNIGISLDHFPRPTKISTSLEWISIDGYQFYLTSLNELFQSTPNLKRLDVDISVCKSDNYTLPHTLSTLTDLKLNVKLYDMSSTVVMRILFEIMPNLYRLDITLQDGLFNGDQWEEIICNYLTKLQVFRLKMKMEILNSYQSTDEYIDQLIRTFQSPFWIKEHQWFVRCFIQDTFIHLCSLSKTFYYFEGKLPHSFKSTYPNDNDQNLYNDINVICDETFFDQLIPCHIRLTNIKSLCIKLPINDQFWSIVSSLNRLNSLSVLSYIDTCHTQLQNLLDQAPNLHYLDIRQDEVFSLSTSIFQYRNKSVYQLDLHSYNYSFNEEECIQLCRSPLAVQCEVLSIVVTDRQCIVYLIENINNLRSLQIQCEDNIDMETNYQLIQWLKNRLSSMCSITNNSYRINGILIWL